MEEVIRITPEVAIPVAGSSSGPAGLLAPGGQGVNTTDSVEPNALALRLSLAGDSIARLSEKVGSIRMRIEVDADPAAFHRRCHP